MQKKSRLGRTTAHRTAMLRALVTFLFEKGRIETTLPKARAVKSVSEKMITLAKKDTLQYRRMVYGFITKKDVAKKLFDNIAPELSDRNCGYTRIVKIGPRRGDAAEMAIVELVQYVPSEKSEKVSKNK